MRYWITHILIIILIGLSLPAFGLYEDEYNSNNWQKTYMSRPSFIKSNKENTHTVICGEHNIVGMVNNDNGEVLWRQTLTRDAIPVGLHIYQQSIVAVALVNSNKQQQLVVSLLYAGGDIIWQQFLPLIHDSRSFSVNMVDDVDVDNFPEVVISSSDRVWVLSGLTGVQLYNYSAGTDRVLGVSIVDQHVAVLQRGPSATSVVFISATDVKTNSSRAGVRVCDGDMIVRTAGQHLVGVADKTTTLSLTDLMQGTIKWVDSSFKLTKDLLVDDSGRVVDGGAAYVLDEGQLVQVETVSSEDKVFCTPLQDTSSTVHVIVYFHPATSAFYINAQRLPSVATIASTPLSTVVHACYVSPAGVLVVDAAGSIYALSSLTDSVSWARFDGLAAPLAHMYINNAELNTEVHDIEVKDADKYAVAHSFITVTDSALYNIDLGSGEVVWIRLLPHKTHASPLLTRNKEHVCVVSVATMTNADPTRPSFVYCVNGSNGQHVATDSQVDNLLVQAILPPNHRLRTGLRVILDDLTVVSVTPDANQRAVKVYGYHVNTQRGDVSGYMYWTNSTDKKAIRTYQFGVGHILAVSANTHTKPKSLTRIIHGKKYEKYVNENTIVVVSSQTEDEVDGLTVSLINTVSGTVLETFTIEHATLPVNVAYFEHKVVVSYWNQVSLKAEVSVVEVYTGLIHNSIQDLFSTQHTLYSNFGYSVSDQKQPAQSSTSQLYTSQATFAVPYTVVSMTTTSSKHNVNNVDVVVTTATDSIFLLPSLFLDPLRPVTNTNANANEEAEDVVPYQTWLPLQSHHTLSTNRTISRPAFITSIPTLRESTTVIVTGGCDWFASNVYNSGKFDTLSDSFDKVFNVITVLLVAIATIVAKVFAEKNKLAQEWK